MPGYRAQSAHNTTLRQAHPGIMTRATRRYAYDGDNWSEETNAAWHRQARYEQGLTIE